DWKSDMEKNLKYAALLDIYSGLLTEKQAEALDYYYNEDYSLAEISELMDITRQGVRDFIKRGEAVLLGAEEKLGLYARFKGLEKIKECAEAILELNGRLSNSVNIHSLARQIINEAESIQNGEK
ncbi:MAG: sigma factor-like helix-turn-helix DNA-binding protein, partial [Clostridia bacterium]